MRANIWTSSAALAVSPENRRALERIARSGKTEQRIALRALIVLGAAAGKSNNALAKELKTSRPTVLDWRRRFAEGGIKALYDVRPRGRSFKPLARAKEAIIANYHHIEHHDADPKPFGWTKSANAINLKVDRRRAALKMPLLAGQDRLYLFA